MQVLALTAIFKADFGRIGRRPIRPDMADKARFWPNQPGSTRIEAALARIEPSQRESEKKKKTQTQTDAQATASDASSCVAPRRTPRPALRHVGRGCGTSGAASVLSRGILS